MRNETGNPNSSYSTRNSVIAFLASLVAGAVGIYAGAIIVLGSASITTAVMASLVGAAVWGLTSYFLGWIPLIGSLITFVAWLGAINWFYAGGWLTAAQIAIFAWIISLLTTYLISAAGVTNTNALGVPGN